MNGLTGMEKFSHLEDKIYLTIEFVKKLKEDKERLESDAAALRQENARLKADNEAAEQRLSELASEREMIQTKVDAMLDAITALDPEAAQGVHA